MNPVLDGLRVVDLTTGIAGSVAALLLAEAGADVVLVEPPEGSADRSGAGFHTWNRSKRSAVADINTVSGLTVLHDLLAAADVLIHNENPTKAIHLGLDDDSLRLRHPHLIVTSVLGWPANHPKADRPVDELLVAAELGLCDEQMPIGREGPVYVRAPVGNWAASYLAAIGILSRLLHRLDTGTGGVAHTSLVQGLLVPMGMHWSRAERPSDGLRLGMAKEGRGSQATVFECADGQWLHVMPPGPDVTPLMKQCFVELGTEGVEAANAAAGPSALVMKAFPNLGANQTAFRMHTQDVWLEELWSHDVPAQPCARFGEVLRDAQARTNNYSIDIEDPLAGPITVAGLPLTITPPSRVAGPAPLLGAHTEEVTLAWTEPSAATRRLATTADTAPTSIVRSTPLEGMKVLDLGNFLAGPYATQVFSDLGAEVIKLEMTTGDPMRPGDWAFAGCQRGKRSLALDLKAPESRPVLERLVRWADIVHHNLRLPAARRLGLDPATIQGVNPNAVVCHTSSYGPTGPRQDWPGYDQMFQALCGWEVFGAGEGNIPMWLRFGFMDHLCALSSVVSTLMACYLKATTGAVTQVRGSLLGAGAFTNSETFIRADGTLAPCPVLDHRQTSVSLGRRIAQTADGWVAITADRPDDLAALLETFHATDESMLIASILLTPTDVVLARLHASGVPGGRLNQQQKNVFFDDEDNKRAGLVASYEHQDWGALEQPGALWHFRDLALGHKLAPPTLGQHSAEILFMLGISDPEIATLVEHGVVVAQDLRRHRRESGTPKGA